MLISKQLGVTYSNVLTKYEAYGASLDSGMFPGSFADSRYTDRCQLHQELFEMLAAQEECVSRERSDCEA